MLVTNKVVLQEVAYQLTIGLSKTLLKGNKGLWSVFPLIIGAYTIQNFKEAEDLNIFHFNELAFHRCDPRGIASTHCKSIGFGWPYVHFTDEE